MKISTIKSLLRNNKESLKGKTLKVNGTTFLTLRNFGQSILDFETRDYELNVSIQKDGMSLSIYSREENIMEALKENFDTVDIFAYKVNIERAIEQFGTSA